RSFFVFDLIAVLPQATIGGACGLEPQEGPPEPAGQAEIDLPGTPRCHRRKGWDNILRRLPGQRHLRGQKSQVGYLSVVDHHAAHAGGLVALTAHAARIADLAAGAEPEGADACRGRATRGRGRTQLRCARRSEGQQDLAAGGPAAAGVDVGLGRYLVEVIRVAAGLYLLPV